MSERGGLVMLDCDGVMFDSFDANVAFYDAILARVGAPALDEEGREHAHRMATPQILEWAFQSDPERLDHARRIASEMDYGPYLSLLQPVPGLVEVLEWLRAQHQTAMATNRGRTIPALLAHFDLARHFDLVVGIHDVERPKPAPDMLLHCLERLGVEPSEAVYVGDSPSDLAAASAAGVAFIAVGDAVGHEPRIPALTALRDHFSRQPLRVSR